VTSKRIVAATDFSVDAGNAVLRAAMLASGLGHELELLHVVSRSSLEALREFVRAPTDVAERLVDDARAVLAQSAAALSVRASTRVAVGVVLDEIVSSVADARLLVLGAHGLNPLRDTILGTTAARLLGRCICPVLVVRTPPREPYRNVLTAVDLLPGAAPVVAGAVDIAPGAHLAAFHAYEIAFEGALQRAGVPNDEIDGYRAKALQRAHDAIRQLSNEVTADPHLILPVVERGDAARLILGRAQALGADLIVIGKRKRSPVEALVLGSITRHVLAGARADVLEVPA
jgi:nucleotide-binding universal stress UspA family protein